MEKIVIATDGSCLGNPGPGGWAALLRYGSREKEISGGEAMTTSNRMELLAAIRGLEALKYACRVEILTDSRYVCDGAGKWLGGWKASRWRGAGGKPVRNQDLWQALDRQLARHEVSFTWVCGHSGHPDNERVDRLAMAMAEVARAEAAATGTETTGTSCPNGATAAPAGVTGQEVPGQGTGKPSGRRPRKGWPGTGRP